MATKKASVVLGMFLLLCGVGLALHFRDSGAEIGTERSAAPGGPESARAIPVQVATAVRGDMGVYVDALGTVIARNTVTVRPQVDGPLVKIAFQEGQTVKQGDLLAKIDPRPFKVQLEQAEGQLARDQALLANARIDLKRYRKLLSEDSIAEQQVSQQEALVRQYEGTVKADRGQVDSAKLQLSYTDITAPIAGRLGLRQVDVGNIIHTSDSAGLVVITETHPIDAVFSIPSDRLPEVIRGRKAGETLTVEAWDRQGKHRIATGRLLTMDNQIDVATGTIKLKAEFSNADDSLFPNQFINARLRVETRRNVVLIPTAGVQRGVPGTYCYVVGKDNAVILRPVTLGASNGDLVEISRGIEAGDRVVVDGVDKLREGVKVEVAGVHPVDAGMDPTAVDPKAGIARQGNTPAAAAGSANSAPALSTDGNARQ
jgi:multidrug efflux system membrane fusion protein